MMLDEEQILPEQESSPDHEGQESPIRAEEEKGKIALSRGIWIAAATFVPTFLAIFFGSSYLLGSFAPNPPQMTIESDSGSAVLTGLPLDKPSSPPPVVPSEEPTAAARAEVGDDTHHPPPLPPRTQGRLKTAGPEGSAPNRSDAPRYGSVSTKGASWAPTAAFADRASAERLAASIKRQAHPVAVEVRRDDSTTGMPWVVWVASHPKRSPSEPLSGSRRSELGQAP